MVTPRPCERCLTSAAGDGLDGLHAHLLLVARRRGTDATAEDCAQNVWLDVLGRGVPEDVAGTPARLRAWLRGVLGHKLQDAARRARPSPGSVNLDEPAAVGGEPSDELSGLETAAAVRSTVASMATGQGRECARCLELRYLDGLSLPEVADATGCTVAQVTARLQRAKRLFRRAGVSSGFAPG